MVVHHLDGRPVPPSYHHDPVFLQPAVVAVEPLSINIDITLQEGRAAHMAIKRASVLLWRNLTCTNDEAIAAQ